MDEELKAYLDGQFQSVETRLATLTRAVLDSLPPETPHLSELLESEEKQEKAKNG